MPARIYTNKDFMTDSFTDSSVTGLLSGSQCGCMDVRHFVQSSPVYVCFIIVALDRR